MLCGWKLFFFDSSCLLVIVYRESFSFKMWTNQICISRCCFWNFVQIRYRIVEILSAGRKQFENKIEITNFHFKVISWVDRFLANLLAYRALAYVVYEHETEQKETERNANPLIYITKQVIVSSVFFLVLLEY